MNWRAASFFVLALASADNVWLPAADLTEGEAAAQDSNFAATTPEIQKLLDMSITELEDAAELGHGASQHFLANRYMVGSDVPQSYALAFEWHTRAAEQGEAHSMSSLGFLYAQGQGTSVDYAKAYYWFSKGAELGHDEAMSGLGSMLAYGMGIPTDPKKGAAWFKKSCAEYKNGKACAELSKLYMNGIMGVNFKLAVKWFELSYKYKHVEVEMMFNIGGAYMGSREMIMSGWDAAATNNTKAFIWWERGASLGDAKCKGGLAILYYKGLGVEQRDYTKAAYWAEQAVEDYTNPLREKSQRLLIRMHQEGSYNGRFQHEQTSWGPALILFCAIMYFTRNKWMGGGDTAIEKWAGKSSSKKKTKGQKVPEKNKGKPKKKKR
jgi:TPR repeat protein